LILSGSSASPLELDRARAAGDLARALYQAMKDVTLAYKANDLLALLRIEVEWVREMRPGWPGWTRTGWHAATRCSRRRSWN